MAAAWFQTILTFVGTTALIYTLWLTRKSVSEAGRSANAAIDGAKEAGHASEAAAESNRIALEGSRPWILYSGLENTFVGEVTGKTTRTNAHIFHIIFNNSGPRPAVKVSIFVSHKVTGAGNDAPIFEVDLPKGSIISLPMNTPMITDGIILSADEEADVLNRKSVVWIYCLISYFDPYQIEKERITEVCARISYLGEKLLPTGVGRAIQF